MNSEQRIIWKNSVDLIDKTLYKRSILKRCIIYPIQVLIEIKCSLFNNRPLFAFSSVMSQGKYCGKV